MPGSASNFIGTVTYNRQYGTVVQIEKHLERNYDGNYTGHYDVETFVQYESMWVFAHELVHIADAKDNTVNYTERMTEKRTYEHFIELADGDEECVFYKVAQFMVLLNSLREDDSTYKW